MRRKCFQQFQDPQDNIFIMKRDTSVQGNFLPPEKGQQKQQRKSPMEIQIMNFLGLKEFVFNQFVFRRKRPKYSIKKIHEINSIVSESTEAVYEPPFGCSCQVEVLEQNGHSVPVCKLTPSVREFTSTVIYAHGNSSDLYDSLAFIEKMMRVFKTQFIIFDYSGYGYSRVNEVSEQSICKDLQLVMAWATRTCLISEIVLWGFSLGSFPATYCASRYPVKGLIIQSPLTSVSGLFEENLRWNSEFENDSLSNLEIIDQVNCQILMIHSSNDEIIPFHHSRILLEKYVRARGEDKIQFLQVSKLAHNQMHKYFCSILSNPLQYQTLQFFKKLQSLSTDLSTSMLSGISTKTRKIKLCSTEKINKTYNGEQKTGGHFSRRGKQAELDNIYEALEERKLTEEDIHEYEVINDHGVRKFVFKKRSVLPTGCFCL